MDRGDGAPPKGEGADFAGLRLVNNPGSKIGSTINSLLRKYGDGNGRTISGVYRDHFPEAAKNKLRELNRKHNELVDASLAHYAASGKRKPWRSTQLAKLAYGDK